jgi:hypothetical protein
MFVPEPVVVTVIGVLDYLNLGNGNGNGLGLG